MRAVAPSDGTAHQVGMTTLTGSRDWSDRDAIARALNIARAEMSEAGIDAPVLVSGACPTGADRIAEEAWEGLGLPVERHPADWGRHGRAAGPIRNQRMVDLGADICLAFLLPGSRGTLHCMNAAKKAGIEVRITAG